MKITIYELLGLIKDKKIKDGTKIKCNDFPVTYIYKNDTLGFYSQDEFYELTLKDILENIDYANYEIIEEVEDKEYEDIDYADNLEQGEYIDYANDYEVKFDIVKNRRLINALIRNQKYILGVLNDNNKDSRW